MLPPDQAARVDGVVGEVTETIYYSLLGNLAIWVIAGSVSASRPWSSALRFRSCSL